MALVLEVVFRSGNQKSFVPVRAEDDVTTCLASEGVRRHSLRFGSCLVVVAPTPEGEEIRLVGTHTLRQNTGVGRPESGYLQHGAKSAHDVISSSRHLRGGTPNGSVQARSRADKRQRLRPRKG